MKWRFVLRFVLALALVWCVLVEVAEAVARWGFALELDGDCFLLLASSSAAELADFFRLYRWLLVSAAAVFLASASALTVLALRWRRRKLFCLGAFAAVYVALAAGFAGSLKAWKPLYVAYDLVRSFSDYRRLARDGAWTQDRERQRVVAPPGTTNLVMVIGESLTCDRMSLYGYGKCTTPRLQALVGEGLEVLAPPPVRYPDTARQLRELFYDGEATMAVRLRLQGYRTVLLSAQRHWERYAGVEQMIFAACERKVYLEEVLGRPDGYDGDLLPLLRSEFEREDARPLAVFVHLMGSHFDPADRMPVDFVAAAGLDAYDLSVAYTDEVLAAIIGMLPPNTVLDFVSDHGESVDRPTWRDLSSSSLWRVPHLRFYKGR